MINGVVQRLFGRLARTGVHGEDVAQKPAKHTALAVSCPSPQLFDCLRMPLQSKTALLQFRIIYLWW